MNDHTYKKVEIVGTSETGIEDAVNNALKKASSSIHNMRWFEVKEVRGNIDKDHVDHWQVTMLVGFTLHD